MVICSIIVAIVSLCFMIDLVNFYNPEVAIEGSDYKKFISFEYFKQQELKNSIDSKYGPDLTKLTEVEWNARWDMFKNVTLLEEKHDAKVDILEEIASLIFFLAFFLGHFYLYRRCERKGCENND